MISLLALQGCCTALPRPMPLLDVHMHGADPLSPSPPFFTHSNASFGKFDGQWAQLGGAHFEGALLSSSDIGRLCENPTIDPDVSRFELGCRAGRK